MFNRNEWRKQWEANNPDKVTAQRERDNAARRAKPANETPEQRAERLQKKKEYRNKWRANNPDKVKTYIERHSKWRKENPELAKQLAHAQSRRKAFERDYGITAEDYNQMLKAQGGRCACCRTDKPARLKREYSWRVDHCHTTGTVRGLLCHNCNVSLGLLKEDVNTLMRMVAYICTHAGK